MKIARDAIEGMTAEAEIGKIYRGKVVTIKEFGAFVEFLPGKDGLVHISELANFRVKQTEDIVKMGDEIWVKCLGVDEKGRVRLSRKAAMEDREREMESQGEAGGHSLMQRSLPDHYYSLPPFRSLFSTGVPILMYHKIAPRPPRVRLKGLYVTPATFVRQMAELSQDGYVAAARPRPAPTAGPLRGWR